MDTQLEMHKSSSFTVKDLLDLPDAKVHHHYGVTAGLTPGLSLGAAEMTDIVGGTHGTEATGAAAATGYYETTENPYARWLQTNDGLQQYSGM